MYGAYLMGKKISIAMQAFQVQSERGKGLTPFST